MGGEGVSADRVVLRAGGGVNIMKVTGCSVGFVASSIACVTLLFWGCG